MISNTDARSITRSFKPPPLVLVPPPHNVDVDRAICARSCTRQQTNKPCIRNPNRLKNLQKIRIEFGEVYCANFLMAFCGETGLQFKKMQVGGGFTHQPQQPCLTRSFSLLHKNNAATPPNATPLYPPLQLQPLAAFRAQSRPIRLTTSASPTRNPSSASQPHPHTVWECRCTQHT